MPFDYKSIHELLWHQAASRRDSEFLIFPGSPDVKFTYGEAYTVVKRAIAMMQEMGVKKGDRIAIILPNSLEFVMLYFAGLSIGAGVVTINPDSSKNEIGYILADSKPKQVFSTSSDGQSRWMEIIARYDSGGISLPEVSLDDEAVVIYTSGTTGKPKGVRLTHRNFLSDAYSISKWFNFTEKTRTLCILPLFHNNGQVATLLSPMYVGGSNVIVPGKASMLAFWGIIDKYKVNWTSVMPSILAILSSLPTERKDTTMEGIICGGQVLTRAVQDKFEARFKVPIFEGYGLTETTSFSCFNGFPADKRVVGSIGKPIAANKMAIMGDDGTFRGPDDVGEICIKGHNVTIGYLNLPERNAAVLKGGWLRSGDYGWKDHDGNYFIKGRKDHLIIKGGENVYPADLENIVFQHPAVEECAVIGIPDELLGQDLCVFVKLKEGVHATDKEIKAFCVDKITKFKLPKKVVFIDSLPKTPTKKVIYKRLEEIYGEMAI